MERPPNPKWAELLAQAVTQPGRILEAYRCFHGYSLGNQLAALWQCAARKIEPGPIATFQKWRDLGRCVKRGEKALWLCMPVTVSGKVKDAETTTDGEPETTGAKKGRTAFVWKPRWFVLAQTEGEPFVEPPEIPAWEKAVALVTLDVREVPFRLTDGNVQGYAEGRTVAVSPLAQLPVKTLFHELGHVLLGHTATLGADRPDLPKTLTEAEAESVALLCLEALGLPGAEYARGYIQSWHGAGHPIPETSAQRIFKAADTILQAGEGREGFAPATPAGGAA